MSEAKIKKMLNQLNLRADCFDGVVTPVIKKLKSSKPHIKLYRTVCDSCNENNDFQWYLLEDIILLNSNKVLPFHNCFNEYNIEGCVVSLIVKIHKSGSITRCYTKINKLEIIYI